MLILLIADDDADIRELVATTFEDHGIRVIEAADGSEAWQRLTRDRPDVALLDISMPGHSGLSLAQAVAVEPALAGTKVVMLTGKDPVDLELERRHAEGGQRSPRIDLYVQKPFTPSSLRAALKTIEPALG